MSGDMSTQLDRPYAQQPATRAAAVRYLERTGNADVLDALGLAVDETPTSGYEIVNGRMVCAGCARPVRLDGICRQKKCAGAS